VVKRWVVTILAAAALLAVAIVVARAIRDDPAPASDAAAPRDSETTTISSPAPSTPSPTTPQPTPTSAAATTAAGAPPGACGVDAGAIRAAIDAGVPNAAAADVASCRLAASDPTWASVRLAAKPGARFDPLTVIAHGGSGSWSIVATGGTSAGCGTAPQAVIVDLGQFCAGTGKAGA
jgi:hypothetical protein